MYKRAYDCSDLKTAPSLFDFDASAKRGPRPASATSLEPEHLLKVQPPSFLLAAPRRSFDQALLHRISLRHPLIISIPSLLYSEANSTLTIFHHLLVSPSCATASISSSQFSPVYLKVAIRSEWTGSWWIE
jgi:hypothetical protein